MSTFDADALATLTDEERAAIQSDDEDAGAGGVGNRQWRHLRPIAKYSRPAARGMAGS